MQLLSSAFLLPLQLAKANPHFYRRFVSEFREEYPHPLGGLKLRSVILYLRRELLFEFVQPFSIVTKNKSHNVTAFGRARVLRLQMKECGVKLILIQIAVPHEVSEAQRYQRSVRIRLIFPDAHRAHACEFKNKIAQTEDLISPDWCVCIIDGSYDRGALASRVDPRYLDLPRARAPLKEDFIRSNRCG